MVDPARMRAAVVIDGGLPSGHAANAAAVLSVTLGSVVDGLPGPDAIDGSGGRHPGLIPFGLPILAGSADTIRAMRDRAAGAEDVTVIDFPMQGQQTNDYDEFCAMVAGTPAAELRYLGVAVYGPRRVINKLVGGFSLLR
jgi:hypothetical protein